jgi:hypothetical protein
MRTNYIKCDSFKSWMEFTQYRFWMWVVRKHKISLKKHMTVALPVTPEEAGLIVDFIEGGGDIVYLIKQVKKVEK